MCQGWECAWLLARVLYSFVAHPLALVWLQEGCFSADILRHGPSESDDSGAAISSTLARRLDFARATVAGANALARNLAVEGITAMAERAAAAADIAAAAGAAPPPTRGSPWQLPSAAGSGPGGGTAAAAAAAERLQRASAACASALEALSWTCAVVLPASSAERDPAETSGSAPPAQELRAWRAYAAAVRACDEWLALASAPLPPGPVLPPQLWAEFWAERGGAPPGRNAGGAAAAAAAAAQPPASPAVRFGAAWSGSAAAAAASHVSDLDRSRYGHAVAMHLGVVEARRSGVQRAAAAALAAIRGVLEAPGGFLHVLLGAGERRDPARGKLHDADELRTASVVEDDDPVVVDPECLSVPASAELRRRLVPLLAQAYVDVVEGSVSWLQGDVLAAALGADVIRAWQEDGSRFRNEVALTVSFTNDASPEGQRDLVPVPKGVFPCWVGDVFLEGQVGQQAAAAGAH